MSIYKIIIIFSLSALIASCGLSDSELESKLVGAWNCDGKQSKNFQLYYADGKFVHYYLADRYSKTVKEKYDHILQGRYKVKSKKITLNIRYHYNRVLVKEPDPEKTYSSAAISRHLLVNDISSTDLYYINHQKIKKFCKKIIEGKVGDNYKVYQSEINKKVKQAIAQAKNKKRQLNTLESIVSQKQLLLSRVNDLGEKLRQRITGQVIATIEKSLPASAMVSRIDLQKSSGQIVGYVKNTRVLPLLLSNLNRSNSIFDAEIVKWKAKSGRKSSHRRKVKKFIIRFSIKEYEANKTASLIRLPKSETLLQAHKSQHAELQQIFARLSRSIVAQENLDARVRQLRDTWKKLGVKISDDQSQARRRDGFYTTYTAKLHYRGRYQNIIKILNSLSLNKSLIAIEALRLYADKSAQAKKQLHLSLDIKVYAYNGAIPKYAVDQVKQRYKLVTFTPFKPATSYLAFKRNPFAIPKAVDKKP